MKEIEVTLTVNKRAQTVNVVPRMTLVDCVRDILRLACLFLMPFAIALVPWQLVAFQRTMRALVISIHLR